MKNKFILAISSLFCLATFAVAQDAPQVVPAAEPAPVAAPAPVEVPAEQSVAAPAPAAEQTDPAPVVAPAPNEPTDASAANQTAQNGESVPVIFYYANSTEPQQQNQPQPVVAPQPQPVTVAPYQPAPVPAPAPKLHPKQTIHYGVQASIGTSEFEGEDNDDLDEGLTWNAGAFVTIPISDYIFSFELGSQFIYRKESNSFTQSNRTTYEREARKDKIVAYSLGFPLQMNINATRSGVVNFFIGAEIEVPLYNNLQISINGNKRVDQDLHEDHCAPMSWDFIMGMGINATSHFGIYTRMNLGISDIYDDLYIRDDGKDEYWSFRAVDLSIGLRLFL